MPGAAADFRSRVGGWLFDQPYLLLSLTSLFWAGNTRARPIHRRPHSADYARVHPLDRRVPDLLPFAALPLARDWPTIRQALRR